MMKKFFALVAVLLPLTVQAQPESFAPMIEPLMPAVVNISTTQKVVSPGAGVPMFNFEMLPGGDPQAEQFRELFRQFSERFGGSEVEREVTSLGSGFVIDPKGYVVTNNHVVANAAEVTVIFHDNTHLPAEVVGRDAKTDLALLKVKPNKPLTYVRFGDSDALRVGDWVVAVGNPFGLGGSVSAGIVSARGRNINAGPFDDFIQTDAAINRGNSGGPLFNIKGEVVGINSAIFSPTGTNIGIGFAVPTSLARPILDQLREFGKAKRAWLGVKIQEVSDEIAEAVGLGKPEGALLLEITPDSPASRGKLEAGDVILEFDGKTIKEMRHLPRVVAETTIGKTVEVEVWRQGKKRVLHVRLEQQAEEVTEQPIKREGAQKERTPADGQRVLGMVLVPVDARLRAQYALPSELRGLMVVELDPNSEIARQGVRAGDVIRDVNQQPVASAAAVKQQIAAAKKSGRDQLLIRVQRGKTLQFITVPVK